VTDPVDRVIRVRLKELRLSMLGNASRRITFEVSPKGPKEKVHALIAKALHKERLPLAMFNVHSAVIQMRFDNTNERGKSSDGGG